MRQWIHTHIEAIIVIGIVAGIFLGAWAYAGFLGALLALVLLIGGAFLSVASIKLVEGLKWLTRPKE